MIYIIFNLYAYVHGQTNAFLYSQKGANALPRNEHIDLTIERCLVAACVLAGCFYSLQLAIVELVASALAFSYWHNGSYNIMRARIKGEDTDLRDVRSFYWRYQSPTSSAWLEFAYKPRRNMFYASLLLLIAAYCLHFRVLA